MQSPNHSENSYDYNRYVTNSVFYSNNEYSFSYRVKNHPYYYNGYFVLGWIDIDKDSVFSENERIFAKYVENNWVDSNEGTIIFRLPYVPKSLETRMRFKVVIPDNSWAPTKPCNGSSYNEVEDYIVSVNQNECQELSVLGGVVTNDLDENSVKTINSSQKIKEGKTSYSASNSITLMPGFQVGSGVVFRAGISGCN